VLVVVVTFALLAGLGWMVTEQLSKLTDNLPRYQDNLTSKIHSIRGTDSKVYTSLKETAAAISSELSAPSTTRASMEPTTEQAPTPARNDPPTPANGDFPRSRAQSEAADNPPPLPIPEKPMRVAIVEQPPNQFWSLSNALGPFLGPLGTAGIVVVFVIFILIDRDDLRDRALRLFGEGQLYMTTDALDDAGTRISRYLIAQSIVNGTYGLAIMLGLWIIGRVSGQDGGFPNFVLWGLLCGVLRFIPYIGPWIGAAFPLLLSLAAFPNTSIFAMTLGLFVVMELISNNFMEPWLYGSSTGLSAVAVLGSALFWAWLWGPIGLVLSTPLTSIVVVAGRRVPSLRFFDVLLGDQPVFSPAQRVYQRLLAGDEDDAADVAEEFLKDSSLEQLYDEVFLPALAMAEQDNHSDKLDDQRRNFIRRAMRDMVDDLGDREPTRTRHAPAKTQEPTSALRKVAAAAGLKGKTEPVSEQAARSRLPENCVVRIICLPARDEADEIAGVMLSQLLNLRGYCARTLGTNTLSTEMAQQVEDEPADLVVVSALPPTAGAHARYLCKRLRQKVKELPIVIGLWTSGIDRSRAIRRIGDIPKVTIEMSLSAALEQIHGLTSPLHAEPHKRVGTTN